MFTSLSLSVCVSLSFVRPLLLCLFVSLFVIILFFFLFVPFRS